MTGQPLVTKFSPARLQFVAATANEVHDWIGRDDFVAAHCGDLPSAHRKHHKGPRKAEGASWPPRLGFSTGTPHLTQRRTGIACAKPCANRLPELSKASPVSFSRRRFASAAFAFPGGHLFTTSVRRCAAFEKRFQVAEANPPQLASWFARLETPGTYLPLEITSCAADESLLLPALLRSPENSPLRLTD